MTHFRMNSADLANAIGQSNSIVHTLKPLISHHSHLRDTMIHTQKLNYALMDFEPTHVVNEDDPINIDQKEFLSSFRQLELCRNDFHAMKPVPDILKKPSTNIEALYSFYERYLGNLRRSGHSIIHDGQGNLLGHSPQSHHTKYNMHDHLKDHVSDHSSHHGSHHSDERPPVPPHRSKDSHKKPIPAPRSRRSDERPPVPPHRKRDDDAPPLPPKRKHSNR